MAHNALGSNPLLRLAAGGSLLAAGAGTGALATALLTASSSPVGALPSAGRSFVVDSLADDNNFIDPTTCITPVPGSCTLRNAMAASTYLPGADTITFAPTLSGTIVLSGNLDMIGESLTVTGPGADVITIEGNHSSIGFLEDPSFANTPAGADFRLEVSGLHLNGLEGSLGGPQNLNFSAITTFTGTLDVHDLTVTDSGIVTGTASAPFLGAPISAGGFGYFIGGINQYFVDSVTIERVTVSGNHATGGNAELPFGGSIFAFAERFTLTDSTISENSSDIFAGPLVFGRNTVISGTTITDNHSAGQIAALAVLSHNCTISGSRFDRNSSSTGTVVALYADRLLYGPDQAASEPVTISDTSISYNHSTDASALRTSSESAPIVFDRVTVVGNTAVASGDPGAPADPVLAAFEVGGDVTIRSSTIADNIGAGIALNGTNGPESLSQHSLVPGSLRPIAPSSNFTGSSKVRLSHSTVTGNSLAGIEGVSNEVYQPTANDVILDHAIVFGNGGGDLAVPSSARFSLIGAAAIMPTVSELDAFVDGPTAGNIFGVDPELQPLMWISPLVGVRPILFGSSAWNAGDPDFVPPPDTDQRGLPRVVDIVDIGAYEVQEVLVVPSFTG